MPRTLRQRWGLMVTVTGSGFEGLTEASLFNNGTPDTSIDVVIVGVPTGETAVLWITPDGNTTNAGARVIVLTSPLSISQNTSHTDGANVLSIEP